MTEDVLAELCNQDDRDFEDSGRIKEMDKFPPRIAVNVESEQCWSLKDGEEWLEGFPKYISIEEHQEILATENKVLKEKVKELETIIGLTGEGWTFESKVEKLQKENKRLRTALDNSRFLLRIHTPEDLDFIDEVLPMEK